MELTGAWFDGQNVSVLAKRCPACLVLSKLREP